jgi:hypothetical protein
MSIKESFPSFKSYNGLEIGKHGNGAQNMVTVQRERENSNSNSNVLFRIIHIGLTGSPVLHKIVRRVRSIRNNKE